MAGALAALAVGAGVAVAVSADDGRGTSAAATPTSTPAPTSAAPTPSPTTPPDVAFTILAGGDVLPHTPVMTSARVGKGYDFGPLLAGLDAWVDGADLALCHMEVPVAPEDRALSGYPMFGTTPALVRDLAKQGWDGCSTASNHSVDKGFAGVARTLDVFDDEGLGHVGTARTADESAEPQVYRVTVDGQETVVAHLSATYGTNGMPVDADKPWSVTLIDEPALVEQARTARAQGADVVLVSVHDGTEYRTAPTEHQLEVADALAASGEVDLMIGHHAHVPQPMARLDGGPQGRGMWVAYGLGNMISNQDAGCCVAESSDGLLLVATVEREAGGPAHVTGMEWVGTTVDRRGGHRVLALAELDGATGKLSAKDVTSRAAHVREAVGSEIPELTRPPKNPGSVDVEVVRRSR